jgi:type III HopJ-like effector protein
MLDAFIKRLAEAPQSIQFNETIDLIESLYLFEPTAFRNGSVTNEAGQNSGSCKIFAFARLHGLSAQQTLSCFGGYYRDDVLKHPDARDHQNIRRFIESGWAGIEFDGEPLIPR